MKCRCAFVLFVVAFAAFQAHAQYPARPVRLVVPFPPGGGTDTLARVYAQKLGDALGQQVLIDNRPGAGTNIGAEVAARAAPDGYTLLMGNIAHAINVTLYKNLSYDLVRDFAPVTLLASTPNILVVHPSLPVRSVKDLIALARARAGELDFASSGSGSSSHLAAELFNSMTGIRMTHIPYKGGGPAVVALVSGQVSVGFATTPSVIGHIKSGKMRGLAVTTRERSPATPDLPTISEAGVAGYEAGTWYGLLAPAAVPKEIVARLYTESTKLLKEPDVKERLDASGFEVIGTTPEQFGAFIRSEIAKWAKVVRASGARAE